MPHNQLTMKLAHKLTQVPSRNTERMERLQKLVEQALSTPDSENTERNYGVAIKHFEETWGGSLPATPLELCAYVMYYGEEISNEYEVLSDREKMGRDDPKLNPRSLAVYLAHLSTWYSRNGFTDATQDAAVRKVLREIRKRHSTPQKKARPLYADDIHKITRMLHRERNSQTGTDNASKSAYANSLRNMCFVVLGWWRGFRSQELRDIRHENIKLEMKPARRGRPASQQLTVFLPSTKGDRSKSGETYALPALPDSERYCPVQAYIAWKEFCIDARDNKRPDLQGAPLTGPVFCKISVAGNLSFETLNINSINKMFRSFLSKAGFIAEDFSSHSLRRGILNEMLEANVPLHEASRWVKHKSTSTTEDYLDASNSIAESVLSHLGVSAQPQSNTLTFYDGNDI